jgi:undecaprenyl-diphosphatase
MNIEKKLIDLESAFEFYFLFEISFYSIGLSNRRDNAVKINQFFEAPMNQFDHAAISFFNKFSQHSFLFDYTMCVITNHNLFKGCVFAMIFWWAWFRYDENHPNNREHIISCIISAMVAMPVARVLALTLPFRSRPKDFSSFLLPHGVLEDVLKGWSSFPSDHAVLFFTLSTGLLFVSRKIGFFALVYTILFISLPRIYLGYHFPTDVIVGALIGIIFGCLGNLPVVIAKISRPILSWEHTYPSLFYPLLFFITYQIADMFQSSRALFGSIKNGLML